MHLASQPTYLTFINRKTATFFTTGTRRNCNTVVLGPSSTALKTWLLPKQASRAKANEWDSDLLLNAATFCRAQRHGNVLTRDRKIYIYKL